jgi:nucleoside-diphosphate-sugar epimerase
MFVDCSRAQKELGFQPGSVAAALERAVRWYQLNGYVKPRRVKKMKLAAA